MSGIVTWAVSHGRMILAMVLLAIGAGSTAYLSLPKEGSPDIDIPVLYVSVPLPGISASDSERLLVKPLEAELRGIEGLDEMTAIASENHAGVLLKFEFGWDKTATVAEVRDKVDRAKAEMPFEVEEPQVIEVNLSAFPIVVITLSGEVPERTLLRIAKDLQREIESISSILEAGLAGHRDEMIEVLIDPLKMEAYDVTAEELLRVVSANNALVAAGALETGAGAFSVKLPGSFETAEEIYQLPVRLVGDRMVTLGDIATIRRTFKDAEGTARFNGEPTVALQVKKRTGENIIGAVEAVRKAVETAQARWPAALRSTVHIDLSMDESTRVLDMVEQLEGAVLTAVLLVMVVVVLTLGFRSSMLVGIAIPCSFMLSFALIAVFGMTINNMVMFGLILAVGMLVDGAIVVAEYADRRLTEGAGPGVAYAEAARRMFWPIVSSTATTLCAFLPMLFWPGIPGEFMGQLPVTLIFVLSASLIVALIFLPVIGSVIARGFAFLGRGFAGVSRGVGLGAAQKPATIEYGYRRTPFGRVVQAIVGNPVMPFVALIAAVGMVAATVITFQSHNLGVDFFVKTEPERAIVHVRARGNLSIAEKDRLVRRVENEVIGIDGVESVFAFAGVGGLEQKGGDSPSDAIGQVQVELKPWDERRDGDEIIADVERRISRIPGVIAELAVQKDGPQQGKPVQLRLMTSNWDALMTTAAAARAGFESVEGLVNIDDTRPLPGIDWSIKVDREMAGRFGADIATIGTLVQLVTRGALLDTIRPEDSDEELDIRVRFPERDRLISTLEQMRLRTSKGLVPLSNFIEITPVPSIGEISRFDTVRFVDIRADVAPGVNANEKIAVIERWIEANPLPAGVDYSFRGDQEEQAESMAFLGKAFLGALGLMFAILLAQFNSIYNSILVLTAVVMSVAGVLIGMMVMGQPFSIIMTGTGVVALAGIVVNNNIVLIDTYREFAAEMPRLEAIIRTAEQRIRPVLLTTITTIAGLLPMMFATSINFGAFPTLFSGGIFSTAAWAGFLASVLEVGAPSALLWTQLATAVVFGLAIATFLTLLATPAALAARVWVNDGLFGRYGPAHRVLATLTLVGAARQAFFAEVERKRALGHAAAPELDWDSGAEAGRNLKSARRRFFDAAE
ncbi:efflux RND transporter permease subunit [Pikeienuella piscinae]|uniref:Efflux RND transporter permease subunit n=1 Tax=Pikeienuella piscinae TaxID=2748098 RepID=A0A7L5BUV5_9RHOB|nr:efflux RND transporter permease subunit [Pikeienuella piscinae]QIE54538.1 efflux RND transporter permease subunit [Pikeienuella piscinae]